MISALVPEAQRLCRKLQQFSRLSEFDRAALDEIGSLPLLRVDARQDLIREGDNPTVVRLIVSGWVSRYKTLPDGRRQIVGFLIPGDFCDLNVYILKQMDHSIGSITPVRYVPIPPDIIDQLMAERPRIAQAFWWQELVNNATQREWLMNLGQRSAYEKIANLIAELFVRLRAVGMTEGAVCDFPLTQPDVAEATGLTTVHVNRMLRQLRSDGLIDLHQKRLTVRNLRGLMEVSMFNPNYLHLEREGLVMDADYRRSAEPLPGRAGGE